MIVSARFGEERIIVEIIVEILLQLFGFLLELFLEVLLQGFFEISAEMGLQSLGEPFKRRGPTKPCLAAVGYLLYGAIAGGLSLLLPKMFVVPHIWRVTNLLVTPVICGCAMVILGRFRAKRGTVPMRLDTFFYGYLFALGMALVRYVWR